MKRVSFERFVKFMDEELPVEGERTQRGTVVMRQSGLYCEVDVSKVPKCILEELKCVN